MRTITDLDDLLESTTLTSILDTLLPTTLPLWGRMSAQHMLEHLAGTLQYCNGKKTASLVTPPDKLPAMQRFLHSNRGFQRGFISPIVGDILPDLVTPNITSARTWFDTEWSDFLTFSADQTILVMHPIFGELNRQDLLRFTAKHFRHHFQQFQLIAPDTDIA
jgi:hydroxymethylglutaryl-CoA reductase